MIIVKMKKGLIKEIIIGVLIVEIMQIISVMIYHCQYAQKSVKIFCSGGADNVIKIWNWEENNCEITLNGHSDWVKCLFQLKNGYLLSGSADKTIKIWNEDRIVEALIGHNGAVRSICQINDNYFAYSSFDKTIKIWDINKKICVNNLLGHESFVIWIIYHQRKFYSNF